MSELLSIKQQKIMAALDAACDRAKIIVDIDPAVYRIVPGAVAIDVEHDEAGGLGGIGAFDGVKSYYWTTPLIGGWIKGASLIAHNGVSDFECLRHWGVNVVDDQLMWDTMLIGHIIDSSKKDYSLKAMAKRELNFEYPSYDDIVGKRGLKAPRLTLDKQPLMLVAKYNACDCWATYRLYEGQKACLKF